MPPWGNCRGPGSYPSEPSLPPERRIVTLEVADGQYAVLISRFNDLAARGLLGRLETDRYQLTDAGAAALAAMDRPRGGPTTGADMY